MVQRPVFHSSDVVYYDAAEYLAPLDTGATLPQLPQKGDPAYAPQPIISVPPEADNRTQTIVAPPQLKLDHDVPLPNIVSMGQPKPTIPLAAMASSPSDLKLPVMPASVVAPAPDVRSDLRQTPALAGSVVGPAPDVDAAISRGDIRAPQAAIVEPPPEAGNASTRRLSDINIGPSPVVAPVPQLPVGEQRAVASLPMGTAGSAVVPPPPSVQGSGVSGDGRLIALNLHPIAPTGPIDVPGGNRRGTFAATPEGKPGTAGIPNISAEKPGVGNAAGSGSNATGVPPGLFVGKSAKPGVNSAIAGGVSKAKFPDTSPLLASATPPRVTAVPRSSNEVPANAASEAERKVFGDRKFYAMTLNVPNLNSAGGSWVMHFAELNDAEKKGDLVAPVATHEVDPGYPIELMRRNGQGTVMLSAVIRSDGSVGEVRIVRGIDDRLDVYASAALARWRFRPATRNGDPVALQAVVMIPFRPMRRSGF